MDCCVTPALLNAQLCPGLIAGEPSAPTSAAIHNADALESAVVVQFDAPAADVAAGYYLTLRRWSQGAVAATETGSVVDVTTTSGGNNIMLSVARDAVTVVTPGVKWQVAVPRNTLYCGAGLCNAGKFSLESFGALSRFDESGAAVAPASYANGKKVAQAGLPVAGAFAYYGERRAGFACHADTSAAAALMQHPCPTVPTRRQPGKPHRPLPAHPPHPVRHQWHHAAGGRARR